MNKNSFGASLGLLMQKWLQNSSRSAVVVVIVVAVLTLNDCRIVIQTNKFIFILKLRLDTSCAQITDYCNQKNGIYLFSFNAFHYYNNKSDYTLELDLCLNYSHKRLIIASNINYF